MSGRRTFRALALIGVLLACGANPAVGAAADGQRAADEVFQDYTTDGKIDACRHSAATLELARDNVTPDVRQYASEYPAAIRAALAERARGACSGEQKQSPAAGAAPAAPAPPARPAPATPAPPAPPAGSTPGAPEATVVPDPPAPAGAPTSAPTPAGPDAALDRAANARPEADAPLPLLALGAALVLAALVAAALFAARRFDLGDGRLTPAGHALREARWRWSGAWANFSDWLARGR